MTKTFGILFFILIYEASFLLIFNVHYSEERLLMIPRKQLSGPVNDKFNVAVKQYGQVKRFKF